MDYNLDSLQADNFEQLSQSILSSIIGPHLSIFGDGPDGGREATWHGPAPTFGTKDSWNGYGVLQAKFKAYTEKPAANLSWLKSTIKSELDEWARPGSKRNTKPDFLLFVTNVRLSSVPGHGKDEIHEFIEGTLSDLGLEIIECRVLDYHEICAHLDNLSSIRTRYAAFLTPGDIISRLVAETEEIELTVAQAIAAYTARCLREDSRVNLTQAGTAGDGGITMAEVFVDLPANLPDSNFILESEVNSNNPQQTKDAIAGNVYDFSEFNSRSGITRFLINDFNHIAASSPGDDHHQQRTVLVGGPGQGKSTVTQWLAQLYRAEFLRGSSLEKDPNIYPIIRATNRRHEELKLPKVEARRWPIRIVLTDFADFLATSPDQSLLQYMASKITFGASFELDVRKLRDWIKSYPSLILIDGLDEVPSSSNRTQVIEAIRNFFIECKSFDADIFAVATTRPQGYSAEFSPEEYRHFQLEPLIIEEALSFAQGLVNARMGQGTDNEQKVMKRLRIASREEHTMKLFESPLQVTILEVLLEKLHKAPNDRSRLYSAYFNVISQREQEKSGPLSDLLQRYESDVNFLHRQIGYELQRRGAEVGETTSSLSKEEFDEFIRNRFKSEGHTDNEIDDLAMQFSSLVTERLVFLAKMESEKIGFELRSLQEFMAGEYLVNKRENEVISSLSNISLSAYWRNVLLFAIGSIFNNKEHLKSEISILCDELNNEPELAETVLPGSDLAIDILRDGSCLSMPRYARSLTRIALKVLDYPDVASIDNLAALSRTEFASAIWEEAISTVVAPNSRWLGRAALLSALRVQNSERVNTALKNLVEAANPGLHGLLFSWAHKIADPAFMALTGTNSKILNPEIFANDRGSHFHFEIRKENQDVPAWLPLLYSLFDPSKSFNSEGEEAASSQSFVNAAVRQIGTDQEAWRWVSEFDSSDEIWNFLKAIADFSLRPGANTLASALTAIAHPDFTIPAATPWPITACLRFAEFQSNSSGGTVADHLGRLAEVARSGNLGDIGHWLNAQKRWGNVIPINKELVLSTEDGLDNFSLNPEISKNGIVPEGMIFSITHSRDFYNSDESYELLESLLEKTENHPVWAELGCFIAEMWGSFNNSDSWNSANPSVYEKLIDSTGLQNITNMHISWIDKIPSNQLVKYVDRLKDIGTVRVLSGTLSTKRAEELYRLSFVCDNGFWILRIALSTRPQLLLDISSEELSNILKNVEEELVKRIRSAWRIVKAQQVELWQGEYDEDLVRVCENLHERFNEKWFERLVMSLPPEKSRQIAARAAHVLLEHGSINFHDWLRLSRRVTKSLPVSVGQ